MTDRLSKTLHSELAGGKSRDQRLNDRAPLRVLTCGSVDDGKSTLIGRLLYDAGVIPDDALKTLARDSGRHGTVGSGLDFALLVDGLSAEREQGITIDVAYRYFAARGRNYILIDSPGHEQFTRNMVTGASKADVAVLLVDAQNGITQQTRRHMLIAKELAVPHIILAVNKMDLVDWSEACFEKIVADAGVERGDAVPVCARSGGFILNREPAVVWYDGQTLFEKLESLGNLSDGLAQQALRLPVQLVNRPNADYRGYCGTITAGQIRTGQSIAVQPSGVIGTIDTIVTPAGPTETAAAGMAVSVTLKEDIAIKRGDCIVSAELGRDEAKAEVADLVNATIVWMSEEPLLSERHYMFRLGPTERAAQVMRVRHKADVTTGAKLAARTLTMNEVGECELSLSAPIAFDAYSSETRDMAGFILIDRLTGMTVAAGLLHFALRRATNIPWQIVSVDAAARSALKGQKACCIWMTGLSGAGKSTLADALERQLHASGRHTYLLDGDNIRHGINRDLGFTPEDRVENVRRLAEVARLMVDAGLIVIVAAISPFRADRDGAREMFKHGEFIEVFVDAPLNICEQRDVKGLYRKARNGEIPNFTGIDSPYEAPLRPEIHVRSDQHGIDENVEQIASTLMHLTA